MNIWALLGATAVGGSLGWFAMDLFGQAPSHVVQSDTTAVVVPRQQLCNYTQARVSGFERVRPLLYSEPVCESPRYNDLHTAIYSTIQQLKADSIIRSAAVYVRDFRRAEWTAFNADEVYDPGSMLKLIVMLTWLSLEEEDPGSLDRTFTCETAKVGDKEEHFPSAQAQPGQKYTVRQLLELMIVHSDNRATTMLLGHLSPNRFTRTFTDLGLRRPSIGDQQYRMNVRDVSVFLKALYNGAYLSPAHSEYAMELLTRSVFDKGILAGLPASTLVAHKFGEAGDPLEKQLHETAVVYLNGNHYLITIMTRGKEIMQLPEAVSALSAVVYKYMSGPLSAPMMPVLTGRHRA